MFKRTRFTTISPLPVNISREVVIEFLHDHQEMIDLNPLVKERHPIPPPPHAPPEERDCVWYSLTDKISYLPGDLYTGDVTYTCAFNDLRNGLQTHCFAPAGLRIRDKWTVNGSLPDEPTEPIELGIGAPKEGLYIREDVDMRCNVLLTTFVKRTLKKSHAALIERLKTKAQLATAGETVNVSVPLPQAGSANSDGSGVGNGGDIVGSVKNRADPNDLFHGIGGLSLAGSPASNSGGESSGRPASGRRTTASSAASISTLASSAASGGHARAPSWSTTPTSGNGSAEGTGAGTRTGASMQPIQYYEQQLQMQTQIPQTGSWQGQMMTPTHFYVPPPPPHPAAQPQYAYIQYQPPRQTYQQQTQAQTSCEPRFLHTRTPSNGASEQQQQQQQQQHQQQGQQQHAVPDVLRVPSPNPQQRGWYDFARNTSPPQQQQQDYQYPCSQQTQQSYPPQYTEQTQPQGLQYPPATAYTSDSFEAPSLKVQAPTHSPVGATLRGPFSTAGYHG